MRTLAFAALCALASDGIENGAFEEHPALDQVASLSVHEDIHPSESGMGCSAPKPVIEEDPYKRIAREMGLEVKQDAPIKQVQGEVSHLAGKCFFAAH